MSMYDSDDDLAKLVRQLPGEVSPPAGLWPRIAARLPAREATRLGALVTELPASVEPPPAVWAQVAARIGAERHRRRPAGWYLGAAVLLLAVTASLIAIAHRASVATAPANLPTAEEREAETPGALAAELSAAGVADDVAAALQRDYALVRAQRAAIEQAIAGAPADTHLRELWAHAYETELELNDLYGRTIMTYRRGSDI